MYCNRGATRAPQAHFPKSTVAIVVETTTINPTANIRTWLSAKLVVFSIMVSAGSPVQSIHGKAKAKNRPAKQKKDLHDAGSSAQANMVVKGKFVAL